MGTVSWRLSLQCRAANLTMNIYWRATILFVHTIFVHNHDQRYGIIFQFKAKIKADIQSKSKLLYGWPSVSQYVLVSGTLVGLATRYYFLPECFCLVFVGPPFWLEEGSAICSVITQWSEPLRTCNYTLLSHLRLLQPGGPGSHIYIPQEQGGPIIPRGTGFGGHPSQSQNHITTDGQSVIMSRYRANSGTCDQILLSVRRLFSEICCLVSVGLPLWREDESAVYSAITQCPESRRTRNRTLLSRLRLPQLGGPGSRIYIPQEQGGPVIPPGSGFHLRRLLRLKGYDGGILTLSLPGGTGQVKCQRQKSKSQWCTVFQVVFS
jgi:hypothetical protein